MHPTLKLPIPKLPIPKLPIRTLVPVALAFLGAAGFSLPAAADVLVMTDGSQVEIEGPWREKGRVIEFTLKNGTLGSVRASEVDLEASREATRKANEPPPEPVEAMDEEKPEPVAVWTDKDIPKAAPEVLASATAAVDAQTVQVTRWNAEPGAAEGNVVTTIRGTLQNFGNNSISGLSLSVTITGDRSAAGGDDPTLVRQARLGTSELGPGETTEFTVELRRGDIANVGTPDEFQNPGASFQVVFESNPTEAVSGEDDADEADAGEDAAAGGAAAGS